MHRPSDPENSQAVVGHVELLQLRQVPDLFRDDRELVLIQVDDLQVIETTQLQRERCKLVMLQVDFLSLVWFTISLGRDFRRASGQSEQLEMVKELADDYGDVR